MRSQAARGSRQARCALTRNERHLWLTLRKSSPLGRVCLQEYLDLAFKGVVFHHANVRRGDPTVAVDQQRHRHRIHAIELSQVRVADHDGVANGMLFEECLHRFPTVLIHRNADDGETTVIVLSLKLHVPGDFNLAPRAPRGLSVIGVSMDEDGWKSVKA